MPEPTERRRRAKATESPASESPASDRAEKPARSPEPGGPGRSPRNVNAIWALVTGLAVGFAAGREAYRLGDLKSAGAPVEASTAFIAAENAVKVYAHMADFPAGWVKDSDLKDAGTLFAGLNEAQKTTVMQALNERNCECGCPFGKLATCLQKDPNCPRSPAMAKLAVDLAKQGKGLPEILAAIDAKQTEMGGSKPAAPAAAAPEAPSGPRPVALAAWNPRKGPKAAKVTVVEFSDFQ